MSDNMDEPFSKETDEMNKQDITIKLGMAAGEIRRQAELAMGRHCTSLEVINQAASEIERLRQLLHDVETGDLTVAIQECAELRDQRDALTLRLQASEEQRFRAEAQVRRVREALDTNEHEVSAFPGAHLALQVIENIRAALDPPESPIATQVREYYADATDREPPTLVSPDADYDERSKA